MPVVLRRNQLAYFPVPKVACTSIKQMLYTVQHGRRFEPKILPSGEKVFIHSLYRAIPFKRLDPAEFEGCRRIAVVRDPVRRILSAYRNRVLHLRELSVEKAGKRLAEPRRVCRRLQLLSRMEHHDKDHEQVFP